MSSLLPFDTSVHETLKEEDHFRSESLIRVQYMRDEDFVDVAMRTHIKHNCTHIYPQW